MHTLTSRVHHAVVALTAVLLALLGSAVLATPSASAGPPPPPAQPPGLDHFLCFTAVDPGAAAPGFLPPGAIDLKNQFWKKGMAVGVGPVDMHCNPTAKVMQNAAGGPVTTFPSNSPDYHLLCLAIVAPNSVARHVKVTDQFGTFYLTADPPKDLCLPSLKSLSSPPIPWPPTAATVPPPEIAPNHFTCFDVVPNTLGPTVPTIPAVTSVADEFVHALGGPSATFPVQVDPVPDMLCLPTQKTVSVTVGTKVKKTVYKITNARAHLLCFPVTETPFLSPVFDSNQFNLKGAPVDIVPPTVTPYAESICLPSYKVLLPLGVGGPGGQSPVWRVRSGRSRPSTSERHCTRRSLPSPGSVTLRTPVTWTHGGSTLAG